MNVEDKKRKMKRVFFSLVVALYAITYILGVPAVHTRIAENVIKKYKTAIVKRPREVFPTHPRLRFGASYVICPFVIVNHYEYRVAGLWGWGGITVDVWFFSGSKEVFALTKWIS